MNSSDEDLIKEYLSGNQDSFKILIERYTTPLYNFIVRFVGVDNAPDVIQDVFIKSWKNINKFDILKSHFKTWIFTIARNTTTDYLRKKKMQTFSSLDSDEDSFENNIKDETILPDEELSKIEDKEFLNKTLEKISPKYKEVLILYYQEEMTFVEIGRVLSKPTNTVKSYHHRAILELRKLILHQNS